MDNNSLPFEFIEIDSATLLFEGKPINDTMAFILRAFVRGLYVDAATIRATINSN